MKENFVPLTDGWIYIRHEGLDQDRPALLFLHGLGESGLSFKEVFDIPGLQKYSLVVPDLLGYGRSAPASNGDYSLKSQVERLWSMVDYLGIDSLYIIGHSLGGDLATWMADSDEESQVKGIVNIEGDLTPHDIFFSQKAVAAGQANQFPQWFEKDFKEELVLKTWGAKWISCHRYYASLQFSRPEAFLANAQEIYAKNQAVSGEQAGEFGLKYKSLKIPKLFCWGSESLALGTQQFLAAEKLENRKFESSGHWVMLDQTEAFYQTLVTFLNHPS